MKHWQVFLIWMAPSVLGGIFSHLQYLIYFLGFIYTTSIIGWFYLVGKSIQSKMDLETKEKRPEFWTVTGLISYTVSYLFFIYKNPMSSYYLLFVIVGVSVAFFALIKVILYSAESLSLAEGKEKRDNSLIIAFLFYILGVWFIQPRLNKVQDNSIINLIAKENKS